jgi:putative ABC transport system ATP-binding protein
MKIEFKQVNLSFDGVQILQDFNLRILPHEQIVIFGKSGLGKSTLLKLLLGFVQPESGEVLINGEVLSGDNIHRLRSQIAYVDQDTMIGEGLVLAAIREYLNFESNRHLQVDTVDIEALMSELELRPDLLNKKISELSGGERQRMALVIALLLQRPLLVLDEATASLDPASKKIVIDKLTQNTTQTLLVVTHDQEWKKLSTTKLFDFKEKQWTQ